MVVMVFLVVGAWALIALLGIAVCIVAGRADERNEALQRELTERAAAAVALRRVVGL